MSVTDPAPEQAEDKTREEEIPEIEQEEVFEKVLDQKLEFKSSWAIWEHYEGGDFEDSMKKVAWFNDVISFTEAWVNI